MKKGILKKNLLTLRPFKDIDDFGTNWRNFALHFLLTNDSSAVERVPPNSSKKKNPSWMAQRVSTFQFFFIIIFLFYLLLLLFYYYYYIIGCYYSFYYPTRKSTQFTVCVHCSNILYVSMTEQSNFFFFFT